jgi:predicted nucleotidyltransferase
MEHWNCLVPDRDQWRDCVNTVMQFWVWGNIELADREMECKGEHWNCLVPERDQWRVLINTAMKFCVLHVYSLR